MAPVYHLELRSFPHVARVFNLDREALDTRFVKPWAAGEMIDHDDQRWAPEKTRLKVLESPDVVESKLGLGRGWGEATRRSRDVTETVLAEIHRGAEARPEVEALKGAIAEVATAPVGFPDVMALAAAAHPLWRASEQLSLAEQAVWEMLHQERLQMLGDGGPLRAERWQEIVLSWATWSGATEPEIRLRAPPDG